MILPTFFILFSLILQNSSNGFGTSLNYLTSYIPKNSNYFYSLADVTQEASARTFLDYFSSKSEWNVQELPLSGATGWANQGAEFNDFVFEDRSAKEPFQQSATYFESITATSMSAITQVNSTGKDILGLQNAFMLNAAA